MRYFIILVISCIAALPVIAKDIQYTKKPLRILSGVSRHDFIAEVADTDEKREHGLMFRKKISDREGMLFLFDSPIPVSMWMKDTYIPLDIIFIKDNGSIVTIAENTTPLSLKPISSTENVSAALELKAGMCKKLGININDKVIF